MHFSWGEDPKVLLRDVSAPSLCCILKQQSWNNQQMVLQAEIFYYVVCMCASAVADAVEARKNPIIIDSTFLQQWERDQYIKLVRKLSTLNLHDVCECCWVGFFYLKLNRMSRYATAFGDQTIAAWNKLWLHIYHVDCLCSNMRMNMKFWQLSVIRFLIRNQQRVHPLFYNNKYASSAECVAWKREYGQWKAANYRGQKLKSSDE